MVGACVTWNMTSIGLCQIMNHFWEIFVGWYTWKTLLTLQSINNFQCVFISFSKFFFLKSLQDNRFDNNWIMIVVFRILILKCHSHIEKIASVPPLELHSSLSKELKTKSISTHPVFYHQIWNICWAIQRTVSCSRGLNLL